MCSLTKVAVEEVGIKVFQLMNCRSIQPSRVSLWYAGNVLSRNYCQSKKIQVQEKQDKEIKNDKKTSEISKINLGILDSKKLDLTPMFPGKEAYPNLKYWNETVRLKRARKEFKKQNRVKDFVDYMQKLYNVRRFPKNLDELAFYLKNRILHRQILDQSYLYKRVAVLKPDLAAAHFIISRGGSVKFINKDWIGPAEAPKLLPTYYIPTYLVEGINAEGTNLIKEGLSNLTDLRYLKWLSLSGVEAVNDWFMDWISKEYHETLEHLDISNCKKITYRALSCFYRFEKLKTLKVDGVPDTPEFKVACLMLFDIFPHLEIQGINLDIPQKIEPYEEDIEMIGESKNALKCKSSA